MCTLIKRLMVDVEKLFKMLTYISSTVLESYNVRMMLQFDDNFGCQVDPVLEGTLYNITGTGLFSATLTNYILKLCEKINYFALHALCSSQEKHENRNRQK